MRNTDSLWFDAAIVLGIFAIGNILFGHFEEHRPKWRRVLKVVLVLATVLTISANFGRGWALGLLLLPLSAAAYIHLVWLPAHGVNGWTGEPKEKYLDLAKNQRNSNQ